MLSALSYTVFTVVCCVNETEQIFVRADFDHLF
jgi:hypothetical protein